MLSIWNYNQETQTLEDFRKKAKSWRLKFAIKIHEKFTSLFLVSLQLSQLLFRGFCKRVLENLFSRADFIDPNQIGVIILTKHFGSSLVFCEKMFLKIVARKLAS